MTPLQHALYLASVMVASYVQNLTGFAFGLVLLGLVGLFRVAPLPDVVNVVSALTLFNALVLFHASPPQFDRRVMLPTVLASSVGVAIGVVLINWLSDNVVLGLRLLLGLTIMACAAVLVLQSAPRRERSPARSFVGFGLLSGVLGGLFSSAGPPLVYHFYRQPMAARAVRDALVGIFAANAVLRLGLMGATDRISATALWLTLEAAPIVFFLTRWMARFPPGWRPTTVKRVVCVLLVVVGLGLAVPAGRALVVMLLG